MKRPEPTEYAEFYAGYVSEVPGSDVLGCNLEIAAVQMLQLFAAAASESRSFRYAPGKWTVKGVLGHINDAERIFTLRACASPGANQTPLAGIRTGGFRQERRIPANGLSRILREDWAGAQRERRAVSFFAGDAWPRGASRARRK